MGRQQEPTIFEQAILLVSALAVLYGVCVALLSLEHKNAPQAPVVVSGQGSTPSSSVVSSKPAALLSFPIPYSATVTQYGYGIKEPRTRFYVSKSVKGGK